MIDFLISVSKNTWPYYILAFAAAEFLLLLKEKRGLIPEVIFASVICMILTIQGQYQSHNSWSAEHRPLLLALTNMLGIFAPLAVFVLANQKLVNMRNAILKHFALLGVVMAAMFVWPLWALYVTCANGLDCL